MLLEKQAIERESSVEVKEVIQDESVKNKIRRFAHNQGWLVGQSNERLDRILGPVREKRKIDGKLVEIHPWLADYDSLMKFAEPKIDSEGNEDFSLTREKLFEKIDEFIESAQEVALENPLFYGFGRIDGNKFTEENIKEEIRKDIETAFSPGGNEVEIGVFEGWRKNIWHEARVSNDNWVRSVDVLYALSGIDDLDSVDSAALERMTTIKGEVRQILEGNAPIGEKQTKSKVELLEMWFRKDPRIKHLMQMTHHGWRRYGKRNKPKDINLEDVPLGDLDYDYSEGNKEYLARFDDKLKLIFDPNLAQNFPSDISGEVKKAIEDVRNMAELDENVSSAQTFQLMIDLIKRIDISGYGSISGVYEAKGNLVYELMSDLNESVIDMAIALADKGVKREESSDSEDIAA